MQAVLYRVFFDFFPIFLRLFGASFFPCFLASGLNFKSFYRGIVPRFFDFFLKPYFSFSIPL
jgi:hypothetical protein